MQKARRRLRGKAPPFALWRGAGALSSRDFPMNEGEAGRRAQDAYFLGGVKPI